MTKLVENIPINGDIPTNDKFMATDNALMRILILGGRFCKCTSFNKALTCI